MIYLLIYGAYVLLILSSLYRLSKVRMDSLDFADGLLFSQAYYLLVPMGLILWDEGFRSPDMIMPGYYPFENFYTTFNIFMGCFLVQIFHLGWKNLFPKDRMSARVYNCRIDLLLLIAVLFLFEIYTVYASGRLAGGHWQEALEDAFRANATLILLSNFMNAYRAMVFGLIFFAWRSGGLGRNSALLLGSSVVAIDMLLTLNRITVAYFYILILLLYWDRARYVLLLTVVAIPVIAPLSSAWTYVRSQAIYNGYSVEGFVEAFDDAFFHRSGTAGEPVALASNSIFETSNIQVLHNVIERFPDEYGLFYGWTYFLRPIVIFIPSTLWPGKPSTFGVFLGGNIELIPGLALNSTFIGEPYGNFYVFWPLAFLLMVSVVSALFRKLETLLPYAGHMAFFCGFALGRFEMNFSSICMVAIIAFAMLVKGVNLFSIRKELTAFRRNRFT